MTTLQAGSYWCCFILFLLLGLPAYSQTDISGRVVDEKDNMPLPGASVYFNNTTVSTYTSPDGDFHFEGIRMLNTEMVIYAPGYEVLVYKPTVKQIEGKRIVFKLQAKALNAVTKLPLTGSNRREFINMFRQFFLGVTDEANTCKIVNESSIYITQAESDSSFRICADTALVIINSLLGYKIIYNLEEFRYDYATGKPYFSGYARYEELGGNTKWIKHRDKAYHGSTLHFYRSLVNHQLYEQGFGIFLMKPVPDTNLTMQPGALITPDGCVVMAEPLSAQNILFIDSTNEISINLADELWVQYNEDPASKFFLITHGYMDNLGVKGVESSIRFKKSPVGINYKGVLDDYSNIEYSGYWMYEKVANTLPLNYQPFNSR
jgi:hypothetical protein